MLQWYHTSPRYMSDYKSYSWLRDYKIYVWEPQLDVNVFPSEKALITLSGVQGDTRDILILLRPTLPYTELLPSRLREARQKAAAVNGGFPRSVDNEILSSIFCLYEIIIYDTGVFIEKVFDEIATMVSHSEFLSNT